MAIVVEEEQKSFGIVRLVGWGAFFLVIIIAAYYIFFAAPGKVVVISPPASLQEIQPVAQFTIQPSDVLNSPAFQALQPPPFSLPTSTGPATVGRSNPFIAPSQ